jgi:hypothetical protein
MSFLSLSLFLSDWSWCRGEWIRDHEIGKRDDVGRKKKLNQQR